MHKLATHRDIESPDHSRYVACRPCLFPDVSDDHKRNRCFHMAATSQQNATELASGPVVLIVLRCALGATRRQARYNRLSSISRAGPRNTRIGWPRDCPGGWPTQVSGSMTPWLAH